MMDFLKITAAFLVGSMAGLIVNSASADTAGEIACYKGVGDADAVEIGFEADACVESSDYPNGSYIGESVAIGWAADASWQNIAIGRWAKALDPDGEITGGAIALGNSAEAQSKNSLAIGTNSLAAGGISIAHGLESVSTGGIAMGYRSEANAVNSIAIGTEADSVNQSAIAFGSYSSAGGNSSAAIGVQSSSFGLQALALGSHARADLRHSTAVGYDAEADAEDSVAIGSGSYADEEMTVSFGGVQGFGSEAETRRLVNVADGIADTDAATVGQLNFMEETLREYTDNQVASIDTSGGGSMDYSYVDAAVADAENRAVSNAKLYSDNGDNAVYDASNAYTDAELAALDTSGGGGGGPDTTYVDDGDARTLDDANLYTDAEVKKSDARATAYTDSVAVDTLRSANAYTDRRAMAAEERAVTRSNAYTDAQVSALEERMSSGIAAMAAMPALPAAPVGGWGMGVGTGFYNGESALGIRAGFQPTSNASFQIGAGIPSSGGSGGAVVSTGFTMTFN